MAKRKKINIFRCLFAGLLIFFLTEIVKQELKIDRLNSEITSTKNNIVDLRNRHESLQGEQSSINDPKYIERIAREHYNMVKKEELPIFVKE